MSQTIYCVLNGTKMNLEKILINYYESRRMGPKAKASCMALFLLMIHMRFWPLGHGRTSLAPQRLIPIMC